jgi:hypothetical protein
MVRSLKSLRKILGQRSFGTPTVRAQKQAFFVKFGGGEWWNILMIEAITKIPSADTTSNNMRFQKKVICWPYASCPLVVPVHDLIPAHGLVLPLGTTTVTETVVHHPPKEDDNATFPRARTP